jgi:hypothetical protein
MSSYDYGFTGKPDLSTQTFYGGHFGTSSAKPNVSSTFMSQSNPAIDLANLQRHQDMLKANEEWADTVEPSCQLSLK